MLTVKDISIAFGGPKILDGVSFLIEKGQRIALMGRNGEGKSTMLKILAGIIEPDEGGLIYHQSVKCQYMPQDIPPYRGMTVLEVVLGAFENNSTWEVQHRAEAILTKLGLPLSQKFDDLSGGTQRRVILARALAPEPELLLLDEPTNHMDICTIEWMQKQLAGYSGAVVFVTHDRRFLEEVSKRIIELDRGKAFTWECPYVKFLERKEEWLEAEEKKHRVFDRKLADEEAWIRKGIKARRTRNEGRVRALMKLRQERTVRRARIPKAKLNIQDSDESARIIFKVHNLCHSYGETKTVDRFSSYILRGDRVAFTGANGSGKTTLLRLLLKEIEPVSGTVKKGEHLEIAYFDQHRRILDEDKSVEFNVADGATYVNINGKPRHVMGYLKNFNFDRKKAQTPVKALSGGERNRLLLAKLFTKPSNVLVLDEPTNDLDLETLELLEDILVNYNGTILLVSHDRAFIDNVVTTIFTCKGDGQWQEAEPHNADVSIKKNKTSEGPVSRSGSGPSDKTRKQEEKLKPRRMTYAQRLELESIPGRIDDLEKKQAELSAAMSDTSFYSRGDSVIKETADNLERVNSELEKLFLRWEELEGMIV